MSHKTYSGTSGSPSLDRYRLFHLARLDARPGIKSNWSEELYYSQGLDLASSLTATGNVGSLLGLRDVTTGTTTAFPHFDGNGNVLAYTEPDGDLLMSREYDPFGNTASQRGSDVNGRKSLPWFSSKIFSRALTSRVSIRSVAGSRHTCNTTQKKCNLPGGFPTQLAGSISTALKVDCPGDWVISGKLYADAFRQGAGAGSYANI